MIIKITIGLAVLVIGLIFLAKRNRYHKNIGWFDFKRFFNVLLNDCTDGSLLIIEHKASSVFIQFAKYTTSDSSRVLHFAFPNTSWSQKYFEILRKSLEENDYDFKLQGTGVETVTEFIEIDLSGKIEDLVVEGEKLSHIALKALGLGEDRLFKLHFEGKLLKKE